MANQQCLWDKMARLNLRSLSTCQIHILTCLRVLGVCQARGS